MIRLRTALSAVLLAAGVVLGAASTAAADDPAAPPGTPTAVHTSSVAAVGPLFFGPLDEDHGCSASVVHSPGHDLILTAAHCTQGTMAGVLFAPGYINGKTPEGVWRTTRVWVDPKWVNSQNPQDDFAFVQIAPKRSGGRSVNIEDVTGANVLGFAPRPGARVTVPAYPAGIDDAPIGCTAKISYTQHYPTFDCYGYFGGTSGSPFLLTSPGRPAVVTGVIGGLNQGGCYDWNSFSSAFGLDTLRAYVRAVVHARADISPTAGSDGC